MKRIVSASCIALSLTAAPASAFDFGGLMQTVAPIATPAIDSVATSNPLIKNITTTLGVTPTQAVGGTAVLLKDAKDSMKPADYTALTKQMPQLGTIISAAPTAISGSGTVASQFGALGMDPSMIGKFTPLLLQYIQTGSTPGMAQLVQAALAQ
jgi:hypothetical protein